MEFLTRRREGAKVVEARKAGRGPALLAVVGIVAMVAVLPGCAYLKKKVADGTVVVPEVTGQVCVKGAGGEFCYTPAEPTLVKPGAEATVSRLIPVDAPVERELIPMPARKTLEK